MFRQKNKWNRIKAQKQIHAYENVLYNRGDITNQWGKGGLFSKYWNGLLFTWKLSLIIRKSKIHPN